jgi:hypothetical protein
MRPLTPYWSVSKRSWPPPGAQADLVQDLAIALWCDLVIEAVAGSQASPA